MPPERAWQFQVDRVERIVDGDTYWLWLDLGFRRYSLEHFRLKDWDTPEVWRPQSEHEAQQAGAAADTVKAWFGAHLGHLRTVWVGTDTDPGKYGRWLGRFYVLEGAGVADDLGVTLADLQLATRWPTRWREVYGGAA